MESTSYIKNSLEVSNRLGSIVSYIYQDPNLNKVFLLKGGLAVQLYLEEFKRLFFDIDLDVFSSLEEPLTNSIKHQIKEEFLICMKQLGYQEISSKSRFSYSLDSYCFPYYLSNGNKNYAKIEINYSFGSHLYNPSLRRVINQQFAIDSNIQLVNLEELIGMKLKALLDRGSVRDLYDVFHLINKFKHLDLEKIKKSYIFYFVLACSQEYLSNFSRIDQIQNRDMTGGLYPFIPKNSHPNLEQMKDCVLSFAHDLLKYDTDELHFVEHFYQGDFLPEYLFSNPDTLMRAMQNPIANWKTKIKQYER